MIRQQTVPFTELNLPALVRDYLLGEDNVKPFVDAFPDRSALEQRIQRRQFSDDYRKRLKSVLTRQYQGLEGEAVWNNINSLDKTNTLTICTGHQLALATGPLYVIYKISSVIALTRKLNSDFPDKHFVPVFWMATEDHDFAEINHLSIGDKMINWNSTQSGATGQFRPDEGLQRALLEMKEALGANEEAESMMQLLRSAYAQPTLADATRTLMHGLFSQYGLVCIDANESELKKIFAPVVKRELFEKVTAGNVEKTNRELRHRGYAPQVNAREINLFYLLPGKRERIVFIENEFRVLNTDLKFSSAEMESELEQFPERFSPNVLMRPLYQETVLPNIAYIGGPAEVSYWLQCRSNFEGFGIEYPLVLLRDMALLLKPAQRRTLDKAMLPTNRLFASREQWIQWVAKELTNVDIELEKKRVAEGFERMAAKFSAVDPTLEGAVNGEKQRALNAIDQLEKKLVRAVKQKSETVLAKIGDLHDALFPRGEWQERVKNYFEVSMWAGVNLVDELIPLFDPTEAVCRVLTPQPTAKDAKPETTAE